jgi:hypothetical protein
MDDGNVRIRFRDSWLIRIGLLLLVLGCGPLLGIILAAELGLTSDPNPNPVGPGILAMFSFWPSLILLIAGIVSVLWRNRKRFGA